MQQEEPQLSIRKTDLSKKTAFEGDLLQREQLANRLSSYIERLSAGAVLAIDAPWGEGKTWFGRHWEKSLKNDHKVAFIDAFAHDYIDDPFMLIVAEISELIDDNQDKTNSEKLIKKAVPLIKAFTPMIAKNTINIIGKHLIGTTDFSDELKATLEAVSAETAELSSKQIEEKLKAHGEEKKTVEAFRETLADFTKKQEKPVVIFIDELDRCKPTFAVQLIERLKHFFDVPNLVFVLLINREQLENAVKGVYGVNTDASTYLGKFINFSFRLPKRTYSNQQQDPLIESYVQHTLKQYNFPEEQFSQEFKNCFCELAILYGLSLRDIEQGIALCACAYPQKRGVYYLAYMITLKISNPKSFYRIMREEKGGHEEAYKLLCKNIENMPGWDTYEGLQNVIDIHNAHMKGLVEPHRHIPGLPAEVDVKHLFSYLAKRIDLSIT